MKTDLRIAIFSSICGLVTAIIYWLLRFGLDDNSFYDIIKVLGLLFFFIFVPILISRSFGKDEKNEFYYHPIIVLLYCLISFTLLGLLFKYFPVWWFGNLIAGIGIILYGIYLFKAIQKSTWKDYVFGLPLVLIFALTNTAVIYGNFVKPVFFESIAAGYLTDTWRTDTFFQTSLAQMINTYGIPSIGIDGVSSMRYHFGSHFVYANIANLLQFDLLKFYLLASPVIFSSIFYFVFLIFIDSVKRFLFRENSKTSLNLWFWLLFIGGIIGFVKRSFIWRNGVQKMLAGTAGDSGAVISESYLFSLILFFIIAAIILVRTRNTFSVLSDNAFYCVLLPLLIFFISLCKISTGYIIFCVCSYLFLRFKLYKKWIYTGSFVISLLLLYTSYKITVNPEENNPNVTFQFFREHSTRFLIGFFLLWFLWTHLLLIGYAVNERVASFACLKKLFLKKKSILIEVAVVIAAAGVVPQVVLNLGINGNYFTEVQCYFSLAIFVALIPISNSRLRERVGVFFQRAILWVSFAFCLHIFFSNSYFHSRIMIDNNFVFRKKMLNDTTKFPVRKRLNSYLERGEFKQVDSIFSVYGKPVQEALNKSYQYDFLKKLRELTALPTDQRRRSLVYVDYRLAGLNVGIHCFDAPFIVPAVSGLAQLNGNLVEEECKFVGYGLHDYQKRTKADKEKMYSDAEICDIAVLRGFKNVIVFRRESRIFESLVCD